MSGREASELRARWNRSWRQPTLAGERRAGLDADSAVALTGVRATEEALRSLAPGRRVLHLATHGFGLSVDCPLANSDALDVAGAGQGVFAGLALSGANQRAASGAVHDGIMTAEEIAGLDLRGVEWSVLSACNTGLGVVRPGEGVFGLRRAFEVAGCRSLVMSLWPVADETAREWMIDLYDARFARKLSTAASVHDAGRRALDRRRARGGTTHPWCWAGFIAAGDWR
jgi:CHAT domain-containing protein